ncbi:MAG: 4Fe-4S binding protein, partial [Candidatus Rifleibacteriota bacterium]
MFWAKYRGWFLLIVYIVFFGHTALWHHFGWEKIGHLGFGCIFGTMRDGVVTAGTIFTLLIFLHALFFGGVFCGWMCHWGILQDIAAWIMKKCGIKPLMAQTNSKLIPWFWFLIMIGQVVLFWAYTGFPTSLSFKMNANPVWFMVPRSILMIVLTTI